jgi:hypothetical protein
MDWQEADLEHWHKNYQKVKDLTKVINAYIVTQREKERYLEVFGKFPEEYDWPEWKQGIERSRYVKKLTEKNETSTAKKPSRAKKSIKPPKVREPWRPPPH